MVACDAINSFLSFFFLEQCRQSTNRQGTFATLTLNVSCHVVTKIYLHFGLIVVYLPAQ